MNDAERDGHADQDDADAPRVPAEIDGPVLAGVPPRCRHDKILLGCDDDTCPEQTAYLAAHHAAMAAYDAQMRTNARAALGLRGDRGGAP